MPCRQQPPAPRCTTPRTAGTSGPTRHADRSPQVQSLAAKGADRVRQDDPSPYRARPRRPAATRETPPIPPFRQLRIVRRAGARSPLHRRWPSRGRKRVPPPSGKAGPSAARVRGKLCGAPERGHSSGAEEAEGGQQPPTKSCEAKRIPATGRKANGNTCAALGASGEARGLAGKQALPLCRGNAAHALLPCRVGTVGGARKSLPVTSGVPMHGLHTCLPVATGVLMLVTPLPRGLRRDAPNSPSLFVKV